MLPLDYTTPDGRVFRKTAMLYGECDARCQAPPTAPGARQTYGWSAHTELLEPPAEVLRVQGLRLSHSGQFTQTGHTPVHSGGKGGTFAGR